MQSMPKKWLEMELQVTFKLQVRTKFEPENRTELDFANPTHICEGLSQV